MFSCLKIKVDISALLFPLLRKMCVEILSYDRELTSKIMFINARASGQYIIFFPWILICLEFQKYLFPVFVDHDVNEAFFK